MNIVLLLFTEAIKVNNDPVTIKEWNTYQKFARGGYAKPAVCRYDSTLLAMNMQGMLHCLSCGATYKMSNMTHSAVRQFIAELG